MTVKAISISPKVINILTTQVITGGQQQYTAGTLTRGEWPSSGNELVNDEPAKRTQVRGVASDESCQRTSHT